jgi:hypothetical protein
LEDAVTVEQTEGGDITIIRPEGRYIIVNQDEKIHHSNDVERM